MPAPPVGNYYIYNRLISSSGAKLAFTFQGASNPATVQDFERNNAQIWRVEGPPGFDQQPAFSPLSDPALQAAWGGDNVTVINSQWSVWNVNKDDDGFYIIQDSTQTAEWGLTKGVAGEGVILAKTSAEPLHRWVFEQA